MHQIVANQLRVGDPPQTWQTVQRLDGLGYDWHTIMHMIASLVTEDVNRSLTEHRQPDPADYARRLNRRLARAIQGRGVPSASSEPGRTGSTRT